MIGVTRRREEKGVHAGRRCDTDGREELSQERRARALPARHLDGWTRALSSLAGLAFPRARARALSHPGYKTRIFEPSKQYNVVVVLRGISFTDRRRRCCHHTTCQLPTVFRPPSFARQNPVPLETLRTSRTLLARLVTSPLPTLTSATRPSGASSFLSRSPLRARPGASSRSKRPNRDLH